MTDNEIIKALECCCSEEVQCRNCTLPQNVKDGLECGTVIAKECLDLINRQKAENEHLQDLLVEANAEIAKQETEIERLQAERKANFDGWKKRGEELASHYEAMYQMAIAAVRAEAIKEFAAELHKRVADVGVHSAIDCVVKEMID